EVRDPAAELLALERIVAGGIERRLRDADGLSGAPDPPSVQRPNRHREPLALLVGEAVGGDERAVETKVGGRGRVEGELLLLPRDLPVVAVEQERRDAAGAGCRRVRARKQEERRRMAAVRAPLLRPVEAPDIP